MRREITKRYNYLSSEINSLYHQAAKKMGISDSVQNILYVLCDQGNQALQSEICSISGISRQTINSALSKLEQEGLGPGGAGQRKEHHGVPDRGRAEVRRRKGSPPSFKLKTKSGVNGQLPNSSNIWS